MAAANPTATNGKVSRVIRGMHVSPGPTVRATIRGRGVTVLRTRRKADKVRVATITVRAVNAVAVTVAAAARMAGADCIHGLVAAGMVVREKNASVR